MKTTKPKVARSSIAKAVEVLLTTGARSASVFQHPQLVVTVTRYFKPNARNNSESFVLTIGKPNFAGRKFVKQCVKAGEPFPVKKVQLKFWPKGKTK